jgi:tetratricopeptide (TPR) repeat protein
MMGLQPRTDSLFYYFRLEDQIPDDHLLKRLDRFQTRCYWLCLGNHCKPKDAEAFYGRGFAFGQKGDDDHAIQDYDRATRINPSYSAAFNSRSKAYAREGDYLHAIADYGHFLWLRFGILNFTIRLCLLALTVAVALGFSFKRFRRAPRLSESTSLHDGTEPSDGT